MRNLKYEYDYNVQPFNEMLIKIKTNENYSLHNCAERFNVNFTFRS